MFRICFLLTISQTNMEMHKIPSPGDHYVSGLFLLPPNDHSVIKMLITAFSRLIRTVYTG